MGYYQYRENRIGGYLLKLDSIYAKKVAFVLSQFNWILDIGEL